ncbi:hypothetical protein BCU68_04295 [Vibrio sp. 10N.286.49.B3]|uniref:hypothetical protein n=1 Tax=Vibrio sp. 10N.286.49.B3 TaxID=1880855 RepID=UPI000C835478|nr:hypothetical protein [Vibrio sp. 10N.286.49.B3]PMH43214.1 hypothetical protein BCU68_04295 [Vibrio sp. 10N.286.49.B3]
MKNIYLLPLSLSLLSSAASANSAQVYIEQNVASNAADAGIYSTEAGAYLNASENGQVYIGFDDQGWLAAGYGHNFHVSDAWTFNLYGELGKWETGEEMLIEGTIDYKVSNSFNVFGGVGYNQSSQTLEHLSDTTINTNTFLAGAQYTLGNWILDYQYTHESSDGSDGYIRTDAGQVLFTQGSYRTNEHEVVLSTQIDDWTPYVKYTYFNTQEGELTITGPEDSTTMSAIDNDHIVTLGLSYHF